MKLSLAMALFLTVSSIGDAQDIYQSKSKRDARSFSQTQAGVPVYRDPLGERRLLNVSDWLQQSKDYRDLDLAVIAFAVMRDEVALCPSDLALDDIAQSIATDYQRDRAGAGRRSILSSLTERLLARGCVRRASIINVTIDQSAK